MAKNDILDGLTQRGDLASAAVRLALSARATEAFCHYPFSRAVYDATLGLLLVEPATIHHVGMFGFGDFAGLDALLREWSRTTIIHAATADTEEVVYAWSDGVAWVRKLDEQISLRMASADAQSLAALRERVNEVFAERPPKGELVLLVRTPSGEVTTRHVGPVHAPLERENYAPDVLSAYDHVVADFRSPDPCGRLVLLEGPPGTGKSYFIRGLASEVEAIFVFVSSAVMGRVSAPEMLPALLDERHRKVPIVLVLEDADTVLLKRDFDNLSMLSDVCNLSDGLLAEMIDLRIVATTNAARLQIDEAVLRPGRLCAHASFTSLSRGHADAVYRRLTGGDELPTELDASSVAEIYRLARKAGGWLRTQRTPSAGFLTPKNDAPC